MGFFTSARPTSLKAANAGIDLSPISIHSLVEPGKHACLPVRKILEHYLCAKDTARHWITKMKRHTGMFLNSLGKKADDSKQGDDGSTGGMAKEGTGKGAPGKMSREGGTVVESGRGQAGEACSRWKEIRCKHNMTMGDQR